MIFTSFNFLIFFPIAVILYYVTPIRFRWIALLVTSYFFYINLKPAFALLTAGVTISTYTFTRLMNTTNDDSIRKKYMILNIILILVPLIFFKYFSNINSAVFLLLDMMKLRWPLPDIRFFLPVGISFYTFMAIGYTVDVYNGEVESEKNIGILALFISFFPLILSGPIERAKNMISQFKSPVNASYESVVHGMKYILWGYFMKLVVADRVGIYVDAIFNNVAQHNGTTLLFASLLYPFQIYADLGGYSLIAIGVSKVLGINVIQNFNRPFFSTTMSEFWRRWHMSLISWLTDYVYTPLSFAFRNYKIWGVVTALMVTFLVSGLWHGAKMTFIVWGLMQGVFLSIEALTNRRKSEIEITYKLREKKWYILMGIVLTFILFSASQIIGRAPDIKTAGEILFKIFTSTGKIFVGDWQQLFFGLLAISGILTIEFRQEYLTKTILPVNTNKWYLEQIGYVFLILVILIMGVFDGGQFIYFQF